MAIGEPGQKPLPSMMEDIDKREGGPSLSGGHIWGDHLCLHLLHQQPGSWQQGRVHLSPHHVLRPEPKVIILVV